MSSRAVAAAAAVPRARLRATQVLVWLFFAGALVFAAIAALAGDVFFFRLATEALIFGGLALAVDVLLGRTGLLPLGHALFFGLGAYVAGLVLKHWAASFWLALGVVFATSLVAGVIGGVIAIRAKGVYFALISFGLAQVVSKIVFNTRELGASDGIIGIPELRIDLGLFSLNAAHAPSMFLLTLAYMGMLYAVTAWLMNTPLGRLLSAIKANEHRVPFLGFDPWRVKLGGYTYSAIVAAMSGALYPVLRGFVSPELLFFQVSVNAVINVIVGGTGTLIGPLYGSVLLTGLKSIVGSYTAHHLIVIGLLFMASVVFFPRGLIGYAAPALQRALDRWTARRAGR
ncbi:MAG: branched-chain amino acid ABC transporter permease [Burkholderiales bacterium]|jgi:branched-chain amino acid transport system permease protein|nr:branched-chain amino acid ABC transporter permease [Burkholderiales bacterium]MCU0938149.1 branched-chain amino acid ABC transporter permease [Burkholderiaceae bacterium]